MGLCVSHCGQAQQKAAVVAVSMSHQSSASPARPSRSDAQLDASQSLKRFLQLYSEGSEGRKLSSASPRPSLDDPHAIPHSSELFSLPSEGGSEYDRSRSTSPARGSVASIARSSTSSRAPTSPSGRRSVGVRPGRSSTDKPPMPPRTSNAKKVPARKSCPEPHKNLVETIARLEKFCDVKLFLEKRSSSARNSSHELSAACAQENSILLHDSCRELAQKLLCFANEHAYDNCQGGVVLKSVAQDLKECVPLEKSVASFLKEVENFVSQVDTAAPRQPVELVTDLGESDEGVSRLPSLRFQDADDKIQFTDFEATFEAPCPHPAETEPSDCSLEVSLASGHSLDASQDTKDERPSVSAECEAENSAPVALRRHGHRHSRTTSDFGGIHHMDGTNKGSQQEKKPNNSMSRLALTEISANVTPVHDPLARKNHLLKARTPTGLKRGVTRSLDLQDSSLLQLELGALKRQHWELTHETHSSTQAILSGEESQRSEAEDSAIIERLAPGGNCGTASPSGNEVAVVESQAEKERVSIHGEQPIQESVCAEDVNRGTEMLDLQGTDTGLLNNDSEKSLSMAFDNLLKLLQSPTAELAQNTSELLELLAAPPAGANRELCAEGTNLSGEDGAPETQAEVLPLYEGESWHDAPASLSTTVISASLF
ncbi:hypothetical protein M758_12G031600 [Ceratodon purpureus]|nr:hypothetical protein M758_12G031600 [Ceratodon purpureus]